MTTRVEQLRNTSAPDRERRTWFFTLALDVVAGLATGLQVASLIKRPWALGEGAWSAILACVAIFALVFWRLGSTPAFALPKRPFSGATTANAAAQAVEYKARSNCRQAKDLH